MSRFLLRGLLFTFGASLLMLMGLVTTVRGELAEPYYLEFSNSGRGSTNCRLLYYRQPLECDYLDFDRATVLSPDGHWRAYVGPEASGDLAVFRVRVNGGTPHKTTALDFFDPYQTYDDLVWSPDGRWLAIPVARSTGGFNIVRINVATGIVEQLTTQSGDEWYPAWSPDGGQIAFNARDTLGGSGLFIMDADGSNIHEPLPGLTQSFYPQWSPDGEWLLFQTNCSEDVLRSLGERPCAAGHFDLYRLRLSDGHIEPLLTLPGDEYDPVWSPDGEWVAFTSRIDIDSQRTIFRIRPDGSDLQPVINDPTRSYFSPSWVRTPDNKWHPVILLTISLVMIGIVWRTKP